tara:strand:- start:485 stop:691 length:207 start_codon:yes stop_codon:yes gene_type:complete
MNGYNGWPNRETWLVNLWFNPERKSDIEMIREHLENEYETFAGFWSDMIDFNAIDWRRLEASQEEDEE